MSDLDAGYGGRPGDDPWEGRRQVDELTAGDLRATPAWWFPGPGRHLTGPDAGTVLPVDTSEAAADGTVEFPDGKFLLRAVFRLADGREREGHVTYVPGDDGSPAAREPTVCTDLGQVPLWHGVLTPSPALVIAYHRALGGGPQGVFPVTWRATLHPPGAELTGVVAAFGDR